MIAAETTILFCILTVEKSEVQKVPKIIFDLFRFFYLQLVKQILYIYTNLDIKIDNTL